MKGRRVCEPEKLPRGSITFDRELLSSQGEKGSVTGFISAHGKVIRFDSGIKL